MTSGRRWLAAAAAIAVVGVAAAYAFAASTGRPLWPIGAGSGPRGKTIAIDGATPLASLKEPSSPPVSASTPFRVEESKTAPASPRAASTGVIVAIQPSHQDDTGEGWHEYVICGDIADRTMLAGRGVRWVKAWDISDGLTGSNNYRPRPTNTRAFDKEVAVSNSAKAEYFVSIHNDGGAPSGVLGEYMPGDDRGARLTEYLVDRLSAGLGLRSRGTRAVRLYSLEPQRNHAKYRSLLEIGDNVADRAFLSSAANRTRIGTVLATALLSFIRAERKR